jgi:hypothetical protein
VEPIDVVDLLGRTGPRKVGSALVPLGVEVRGDVMRIPRIVISRSSPS